MGLTRAQRQPYRQTIAIDHPQFGSLNHGSPAKRNAPGPTLVRGLRTGADINQPAISAKTVENGP